MAVHIILALICLLFPFSSAEEISNGMLFDGRYYEREILLDGVETAGKMAVNKVDNELLFSFNDLESEIIKSAYIDIHSKKMFEIPNVRAVSSIAVDKLHRTAYLGGEGGVYKLDLTTKEVEILYSGVTNVWSLFLWDKLYFTDFPNNTLFDFNDGNPKIVHAFKRKFIKFAVQTSDGIYFVTSTGLYHATHEFRVLYVYSTDDAYRFLTKDKAENVYVGRKETGNEYEVNVDIYKINKRERNVEKVATVEDSVYDMEFDSEDNFILAKADRLELYKLHSRKVAVNE